MGNAKPLRDLAGRAADKRRAKTRAKKLKRHDEKRQAELKDIEMQEEAEQRARKKAFEKANGSTEGQIRPEVNGESAIDYAQKKAEKIMQGLAIDEENNRKLFDDDLQMVRTFLDVHRIELFNSSTGDPLLPDTHRSYLSINHSQHMTTLTVIVTENPVPTIASQVQTEDGEVDQIQADDEEEDLATVKKVAIHLNADSVGPGFLEIGKSTEEGMAKAYPKAFQAICDAHNNRDSEELNTYVFSLRFNPELALREKLCFEVPEWATDFNEAFKNGEFTAYLHAMASIELRVSYLGDIFLKEQETSPLIQWQEVPERKRLAFNKGQIHIPSQEFRQSYRFQPRYGYFSIEEWCTVMAAGMTLQYHVATSTVQEYEKKKHRIVLVEIADTNQSTYMGFIPYPDEDETRIEEGDLLKIALPYNSEPLAKFENFGGKNKKAKESKYPLTDWRHYFPKTGKRLPNDEYQAKKLEAQDKAALATIAEENAAFEESQQKKPEEKKPKLPREDVWKAKVLPPTPLCPADMIPVSINRPWLRDLKQFDDRRIDALNIHMLSIEQIVAKVKKTPGIPCKIMLDPSHQQYNLNMARLEAFYEPPHPKDKPDLHEEETRYNQNMKVILQANNLASLEKLDIFHPIKNGRSTAEVMQQCMRDLNVDQKAIVEELSDTPAGFYLIHGPPGTGKTFTMAQIARAFLLDETNDHLILCIGPTNKAAEAILVSIQKELEDLQADPRYKEHPVQKKYGLRHYSKDTEELVYTGPMQRAAGPDPLKRPALLKLGEIERDLSHIELLWRQHLDQPDPPNEFQIRDPRLQHIHLSVGWKMFQVAGIGLNGKAAPDAPKEWDNFRFWYARRVKSLNTPHGKAAMDKVEFDQWNRAALDLYEYVLRNASFVGGTFFVMGSAAVRRAIETKVALVLCDEAAKSSEADLIPIFASRYSNFCGMIMAGDHKQLPPTVLEGASQIVFNKPLSMSLFARLCQQGWPVTLLATQNRMVPEISKLVSKLGYDKKLGYSKGCLTSTRPPAMDFQKWAAKECAVPNNIVFVDIQKHYLNKVYETKSHSRFNHVYTIYEINLALSLAEATKKHTTIGIFTAYSAQRKTVAKGIAQMQAENNKHAKRIRVDTIDAIQGEEVDYAIVDILLSDKLGFLSDPRRLNVACSRARNGLIIIGTSDHFKTIPAKNSRAWHTVREFFDDLGKYANTKTLPSKRSYPKCPYYIPTTADEAGASVMTHFGVGSRMKAIKEEEESQKLQDEPQEAADGEQSEGTLDEDTFIP